MYEIDYLEDSAPIVKQVMNLQHELLPSLDTKEIKVSYTLEV